MSAIFSTYLILPIVGLLVALSSGIMAKKKRLLANKKLIVYFLLGMLALAVPGLLGWLDYRFMPYAYVGLAGLYLLLGYFNALLLKNILKDKAGFSTVLVTSLLLMLVGMCLFGLVFNLVNESKFGLWASTCMLLFIFPPVFIKTYALFLSIPFEIYKVWQYTGYEDLSAYDNVDTSNLPMLQIELLRGEGDPAPMRLKGRALEDMPFGLWFYRVLSDYNRRMPQTPIDYSRGDDMGWVFYVKPSLLQSRRYMDYQRTLKGNKLKETHTIIAKRVRKEFTEE